MRANLRKKLNKLVKRGEITEKDLREITGGASSPWNKAKGLLRDKDIDALDYQKKLRKEWEG